MNLLWRMVPVLLAGTFVLCSVTAIEAQEAQEAQEVQEAQGAQAVISANPFGLLLGLFNTEYERIVSESATFGFGGSSHGSFWDGGSEGKQVCDHPDAVLESDRCHWEDPATTYVNADVFYRYYPRGDPLDGWSFGVKAGLTKVTGYSAKLGIGFDTNWSWLLGKENGFYIGAGFGLKRLYGIGDESGLDNDFPIQFIPTFRIINVGWAF
jgi:hypothetical protein